MRAQFWFAGVRSRLAPSTAPPPQRPRRAAKEADRPMVFSLNEEWQGMTIP